MGNQRSLYKFYDMTPLGLKLFGSLKKREREFQPVDTHETDGTVSCVEVEMNCNSR